MRETSATPQATAETELDPLVVSHNPHGQGDDDVMERDDVVEQDGFADSTVDNSEDGNLVSIEEQAPDGSGTQSTELVAADLVQQAVALNVPPGIDPRLVYGRSAYLNSQLSFLVARYAQTRGDLLVSAALWSVESDPFLRPYAERVVDHLESAKALLESKTPQLPVASNLLSMAERALIWLYPPEVLKDRCAVVRAALAGLTPPPQVLLDQLDSVLYAFTSEGIEDVRTRQVLTDASAHLHQVFETALIEDDLQVNRLRRVRAYLFLALLLVVVVVPVSADLIEVGGETVWPVYTSDRFSDELELLLAAVGLGAVGAVGGIVSGMLGVRDSPARLSEYRTSLLALSLRPLVGAIAAISLYLLLSWNVVTGIEVTNPGTYILVAFLSGFSERYFLGVLSRQEDAARAVAVGGAAGREDGSGGR